MYETRPAPAAPQALADLEALIAHAELLGAAAAGCDGWVEAHRDAALRRLDRLTGVLAAVRGQVLMAKQRAFVAGGGDRDVAADRARATRAGLGEARREVRQAETMDALPRVHEAVVAGRVPVAHLDALARATAGAGEVAAAALAAPDGQDRLVRLAERLSVKEFAGAVARLVASYDPAGLERSAAREHDERFLHLSHQADGTYLKGKVDRVAGDALRSALAAMNQAPDAERTKAQADADALLMLVDRAMSGMAGVRARRTGGDGRLAADPEQDAADARVSGVAARPVVSILVAAQTFVEVRTAQARAQRSGEDRWWDAVAPATLEDGTPIAMSELGRALCDCELGRIVLDAESMPLDVGRASRLFTPAQRLAIIVRDRTCAWNGCDVPAAWCEAHHVRWWERDTGPTAVQNGVLLCSHHHHVVHRQDLAIERLTRPPVTGRGKGMRGLPDEPTRYEFRSRGGEVVNAPPGGSERLAIDGTLQARGDRRRYEGECLVDVA